MATLLIGLPDSAVTPPSDPSEATACVICCRTCTWQLVSAMAASFRRQAAQCARALEARGSAFLQASEAEISASQLEDPQTERIFLQLTTKLSNLLRAARDADEPLSLTEARSLYTCSLTDMLVSILSRLQWKPFCTQLDHLATHGRAFMLAGGALDCILELFLSGLRIQPSRAAVTAKLELYGRCCQCALHGASAHSSWVRG